MWNWSSSKVGKIPENKVCGPCGAAAPRGSLKVEPLLAALLKVTMASTFIKRRGI